jgi:hypothetical protein
MTSTSPQSSSSSLSFYLLCSLAANPQSFSPPLGPIIVDGIVAIVISAVVAVGGGGGRDVFAVITAVCVVSILVIIQLIVTTTEV